MEKRNLGRPVQDNKAALREILASPDKRETFIQCVDRLVKSKEALQVKADLHSDDTKSTAEAYTLGKGFLSNIVNTIVKGDIVEAIAELGDKTDILELFTDRLDTE